MNEEVVWPRSLGRQSGIAKPGEPKDGHKALRSCHPQFFLSFFANGRGSVWVHGLHTVKSHVLQNRILDVPLSPPRSARDCNFSLPCPRPALVLRPPRPVQNDEFFFPPFFFCASSFFLRDHCPVYGALSPLHRITQRSLSVCIEI